MESSFFKLDNLSISFGGIKALQNISFSMNKGEIFSIIGPNGAGKTT
ncbi:MAG: ATP-binding cassette domain-containing protein, partial [Desulfobacula sp.]|nr:ATP-binding cassette domain-containing protein [Desulfobacula sp.]